MQEFVRPAEGGLRVSLSHLRQPHHSAVSRELTLSPSVLLYWSHWLTWLMLALILSLASLYTSHHVSSSVPHSFASHVEWQPQLLLETTVWVWFHQWKPTRNKVGNKLRSKMKCLCAISIMLSRFEILFRWSQFTTRKKLNVKMSSVYTEASPRSMLTGSNWYDWRSLT